MMENKPEEDTPTEKLNVDQTIKQTKIFHTNRDLYFCIRNGIGAINIYSVCRFEQTPWLTIFTKYSHKRSKTKTEFKKHLYKLF